ncbi:MAG: hypothetical protein IPI30_03500 [Saprospiraceae bacterium]|nr:hypothetical protein [Candidatus Vicinibacter affinis]
MAKTKISQSQVNTRELFSVKQILLSRGFEIKTTNTEEKLLVTEPNQDNDIWKLLFDIYNNSSLRTELKDFLYKRKVPTSNEILMLLNQPCIVKERSRFDNTFEWYAGELMIRKFAAFSASHGVTIKDLKRNSNEKESGDFDSLVVLRDTNLAYFECKAGSFDFNSIRRCYVRMQMLNCQYSILFCVDNIDEEKLKWEISKIKVPGLNFHRLDKINIYGKQKAYIYELHNCYIIDMSGDVETKLRTALRINAAKINQLHHGIGMDDQTYKELGYKRETLDVQIYQ